VENLKTKQTLPVFVAEGAKNTTAGSSIRTEGNTEKETHERGNIELAQVGCGKAKSPSGLTSGGSQKY
jgi:hypothetical protein